MRLGNTVVGALGQPGDGAVHSAGLVVGGEGEGVVVSLLPQLEQGGGQQRQRARLAVHVGDQGIGQLGSTRSPTRPAGSSTARRSSACIGPTSTWLAASRSASAG